MVCNPIDYRNDVKMFKIQKEWFHSKVLHILTSFPWSIRAQTMEKCCRFVFFTITLTVFHIHFRAQVRGKQIAPPSRHCYVISMVCTLIAGEIAQLLYKNIYIYMSLQNCDSLCFPSRFKSSNLRHLKDCFIEQCSPLTPHVLRTQQPLPCNQPKVTL